jgi:hypothetical protein
VTVSGDGSLNFAGGVTENFNVVLRGGEKDDAANFGETQSRFYVESGEDGFDGDHVRRKLANEIANERMDGLKSGSGGFFAFFRDAQRAVMERTALAALRFDNAVTGRAGGRRINAQDAKAADFARWRHVRKSKARRSRTQSS